MPHLRLVDAPEAGSQKPFPLSVALEDGRTHGTGDLAVCSADGLLTLVGRESTAIRRGERWISPFEIDEPGRYREAAWELAEVIGYVCGLGEIQRSCLAVGRARGPGPAADGLDPHTAGGPGLPSSARRNP